VSCELSWSRHQVTAMNLLNISYLLLLGLASASAANNMVFKKLEVQMGAVGSDDDIRVKICDGVLCCTTDKLSNLLTSEWVANKKEKWDGGKLGNCSRTQFSDKLSSIGVIILKNGKKDGLEVAHMNITGQIGKDKKMVTVFKCGSYKLSKTDKEKSGVCVDKNLQTEKFLPPPSLPPKTSYTVNMISVQMGDDGTDDDVSLEVCSDKDCCDTGKLDKRLRDDWKKKKLEKWEKKHLGACKDKTFDACKGFEVAIKKKASKDTLKVTTITLELADSKKSSVKKNFVCSDYSHGAKDTVTKRQCKLDSRSSLNCSPKTKTSASTSLTSSPTTLISLLVIAFLSRTH